ncbi:MAG: hypothetical protein WC916_06495 [Candidatus Woesearchaeota archaeon]
MVLGNLKDVGINVRNNNGIDEQAHVNYYITLSQKHNTSYIAVVYDKEKCTLDVLVASQMKFKDQEELYKKSPLYSQKNTLIGAASTKLIDGNLVVEASSVYGGIPQSLLEKIAKELAQHYTTKLKRPVFRKTMNHAGAKHDEYYRLWMDTGYVKRISTIFYRNKRKSKEAEEKTYALPETANEDPSDDATEASSVNEHLLTDVLHPEIQKEIMQSGEFSEEETEKHATKHKQKRSSKKSSKKKYRKW